MSDKIAIVGGSIAGLITALNIRRRVVDIFEEHSIIGLPFKCSGLINAELFEQLDIGRNTIQNKLCGSVIVSPSGKIIKFDTRRNIGYVVNRPIFENEIVKRLGNNVRIYNPKKIESIRELKDYRLIVGADGTFSFVRRNFNFSSLRYVFGVQYEVSCPQKWPDCVTLFIDKNYSNYHIWNIPVGNRRSRLGLAGRSVKEGFQLLDKFILEKFGRCEVVSKMCGAVPVGYVEKIIGNKVALVGDAAGQNRPLSGGGLNLAIKYGHLLGKAIEENELRRYQRAWEAGDLQKIKKESKMLEKWKGLSNQQIDQIIENLPKPDFRDSTLFTAVFRSIVQAATCKNMV